MTIAIATNAAEWDAFLGRQRFRPFLQSWTMGEVYRAIGQEPLRLIAKENDKIVGICQAIFVPARRGKHLAIAYGPVYAQRPTPNVSALVNALKDVAFAKGCRFIRMSPFLPVGTCEQGFWPLRGSYASPLHLLAENVWYLPLRKSDPWNSSTPLHPPPPEERERWGGGVSEEEILMDMRKTTRNLIRRAEREGVAVEASRHPTADLEHFLKLHDETRKRHSFTPYTNDFFRAQVEHFAKRNECTLYLARYNGEVIASSIHMHAFGETSYHHGASSHVYDKIPASYLLQWTAIRDALKREDHIYNFWGIAPLPSGGDPQSHIANPKHPFSGVTTFKTGFGGKLLELAHCRDIPVRSSYHLTRAFEQVRKWRRGF